MLSGVLAHVSEMVSEEIIDEGLRSRDVRSRLFGNVERDRRIGEHATCMMLYTNIDSRCAWRRELIKHSAALMVVG